MRGEEYMEVVLDFTDGLFRVKAPSGCRTFDAVGDVVEYCRCVDGFTWKNIYITPDALAKVYKYIKFLGE